MDSDILHLLSIIIFHLKNNTMKLKKFIPVLLMAICTSFVMPAFAKIENPVNPTEQTDKATHDRQLMARLQEIRDMDKSNLTSSEKKALRKELKEMKKEVRADRDRRNGIYLSVGAIIIIILLLILLL
jgi:ABC-type transport system involved in cytochrome bd biosynthesis fused ATPase/permease subunit